MFGLTSNQSISGKCLTVRVASISIISLSYGKTGPLRAINSLSTEDKCLQLAGLLVQNEATFLEFSLK